MNQELYDREFQHLAEKDPYATATRLEPGPTSSLAVASLVFGILAYTFLPFLGAILAVVFGHAALGQIRDPAFRYEGKAMARAGLALGYLQMALVALGLLLLALLIPYGIAMAPRPETETVQAAIATPPPAVVATPGPPVASVAGVKMVNEMGRADYQLIHGAGVVADPDEVVAFYNAGGPAESPEFALVTSSSVLYLKDGAKTAFDLEEIEGIKDDAAFEQAYHVRNDPATGRRWPDEEPNVYHVEIARKNGSRIRIKIRPAKDGASFYEAIRSAWTAAGGRGA